MSEKNMTEMLPWAVLAFSNGVKEKGTYLDVLDKERDAIGRVFRSSRYILRDQIDNPGLDDLIGAFNKYHRYACIFHYSGHASGKGFSMKDVNGEARTRFVGGVSKLVNTYKKVKLVFLNGCSTRRQIDFFQDTANPPVVIATMRPVKDEVAAYFAEAFYQQFILEGLTVRMAFDKACELLEGEYGTGEEVYRDILWDGQGQRFPDQNPYVIRAKEAGLMQKTLREWKEEISRKVSKKTLDIEEEAYLRCNRYDQCLEFEEAFETLLESEKKYALGVFIQGPDEERGHKLIERFLTYEIPAMLKKKKETVVLEPEPIQIDFPRYKDFEREREKQKVNKRRPHQGTLKTLFNHFSKTELGGNPTELLEGVSRRSLLCIEHRIVVDSWHADTGAFISHYLEHYWQKALDDTGFMVIVFFNVVCAEPKQKLGKLLRWITPLQSKVNDSFRKIQQSQSETTVVLSPLQAVNPIDINQWILDHLPDEPTLFKDRFTQQKSWSMASIEKVLKAEIKRILEGTLQQQPSRLAA